LNSRELILTINHLKNMSDQIKPINSKETVEVIKFLVQYEKEKVYDSLNKIDNIRNTVNKFYPFILIALTLRLESFENIQKIIALILFSILTFVSTFVLYGFRFYKIDPVSLIE
jgi:hypothetical protein